MKIQFTARHFTPSDDIRTHALNSVERLDHFSDGIIHAEVILAEEKKPTRLVCHSEFKVKAFDTILTSRASGARHLEVIDTAAKKLERQLEKYKQKRQRERLRKSKLTSARA